MLGILLMWPGEAPVGGSPGLIWTEVTDGRLRLMLPALFSPVLLLERERAKV